MLRIVNLEEIESHLLRVPGLVEQLSREDPSFLVSLHDWLAAAEDTLKNNRLAGAGSIAAIRGSVISLQRGALDAAAAGSRVPRRRARDLAATGLLKEAAEKLTALVAPRRAQLDEAERIAMQVVTVARTVGMIPPMGQESRSSYLGSVVRLISSRPELASHLVHISGMLGEGDTQLMLDRVLTRSLQ